jgi:predicted regulator of Ras-like GTPase activity (Roadblock/LC7/MglB family)
VIVDVVTTPVMEERRTLKGTPNRKRPPRHGIFASLPIFRRRTPEELPATAERPALESRVAEGIPSMPLALEPLWKLSPHDQMADPSALQALFMTEEKLTLDRVMTLAGDLPGLRACVLAHGEKVICTSKTPAGIDLQTLSGQAMTMLSQIRDSSANLGLGAVPAVTLHAEQGALSFLHNGELCLLVLHTDRGFVPGVRERLLEMLTHLSSAKALPSVPDVPSVVEAPQP